MQGHRRPREGRRGGGAGRLREQEDLQELATDFYGSEACYGYTSKGFAIWDPCPTTAKEAKKGASVLVTKRQRLGKKKLGPLRLRGDCTKPNTADDPTHCVHPAYGFIASSANDPTYGFDLVLTRVAKGKPGTVDDGTRKAAITVGEMSIGLLMGKRGKKVTIEALEDPMTSPLCQGKRDAGFKGVEVILPVSGHPDGATLHVTVSGGILEDDGEGYMDCNTKNLKQALGDYKKLRAKDSVHKIMVTQTKPGSWPCHIHIAAQVRSGGTTVDAKPFGFGWGCME